MAERVPVDVIIYFPDRHIRIKSILESLNMNAISYGGMQNDSAYPIPVGASYTLAARVSDWKEGKDGRPALSPAPVARQLSDGARKQHAGGPDRSQRSRRRARSRARKRDASQVHGDGA